MKLKYTFLRNSAKVLQKDKNPITGIYKKQLFTPVTNFNVLIVFHLLLFYGVK